MQNRQKKKNNNNNLFFVAYPMCFGKDEGKMIYFKKEERRLL